MNLYRLSIMISKLLGNQKIEIRGILFSSELSGNYLNTAAVRSPYHHTSNLSRSACHKEQWRGRWTCHQQVPISPMHHVSSSSTARGRGPCGWEEWPSEDVPMFPLVTSTPNLWKQWIQGAGDKIGCCSDVNLLRRCHFTWFKINTSFCARWVRKMLILAALQQ